MPKADVTICIPTWQAESFIERTLACARAQTYDKIRILVSVDRCDDGTEAICRNHAAQDSRIDVRVQEARLGWSRNANFLLDQVDTEFCFLYFHDDIIEPTYTERLLAALIDNPDATSAHCDLERFGDKDGIEPGINYDGTTTRRLARLLVGPVKGALLRSLMRSEILPKGIRFPVIAGDGFWRCHPFPMNMVAAGPARRVPEILYRRWHRPGSLTKTWQPENEEALVDGQQQSTAICLGIIRDLGLSKAEVRLLNFCLFINMMSWTRTYELRLQNNQLIKPERISDVFQDIQFPKDVASVDPEILEWVLKRYGRLLLLEGKHAWQQNDRDTAFVSIATALSLNPGLSGAFALLANILETVGLKQSAIAVKQRRRLLRASEKGEEEE